MVTHGHHCSWLLLVVLLLLAGVYSSCDACVVSLVKKLVQTNSHKASYMGCYKDRKDDRDMKYFSESANDMTLEKCNTQCKAVDAKYYGAQGGTECYCGSEYGKYSKEADEYCDRVCIGNEVKSKISTALLDPDKCGGDLFNSVYAVS